MPRIFVANYRNENSQWTNLYAIDSEYGGDELNERNLEKAIEKSGAYSYDSFSLNDIEYDGEQLIYDQLSDEIKEKKIQTLEREIKETEEKINRLKAKETDESGLRDWNIEFHTRELKMSQKMLEDVRNDMW